MLTITKHKQLLTLANSDLSQQRQKVERNALGIFSYDSTGVGARRVEVAQQGTVPLSTRLAFLLCVVALGLDMGANELLDGILCVSVGVCGTQRAGLGNGDHALEACGISVDCSGRGEDDVGDIVTGHGLQQSDGAADVDAPVLEGDLARLADGLQGSKVNNIVDVGVFSKDVLEGLLVGDVGIVKDGSLAADGLDAVQDLLGRVVQVVDNDDLVVGLEQGEGCEAADVSGATVATVSAWRGSPAQSGTYPVTRTEPTGIVVGCKTMGKTRWAGVLKQKSSGRELGEREVAGL